MSLTRKKSYAVAFKGTQGLHYNGVTPGTPGIFLRNGTAPLACLCPCETCENDARCRR